MDKDKEAIQKGLELLKIKKECIFIKILAFIS